jgi:hypothetical protein
MPAPIDLLWLLMNNHCLKEFGGNGHYAKFRRSTRTLEGRTDVEDAPDQQLEL